MLVPGFAPAGASVPQALDGFFPELIANAANQGRLTPPGGSSAILFNPLGSTCPQGESPPDPSAAKKTYISGYVLERHAPVPFPPTPCDSSLLPSDPRTSRRLSLSPRRRRKIVNNVVTRISTPYSTGHIPCPYGCGRSFKHATQKAIHVRRHTLARSPV